MFAHIDDVSIEGNEDSIADLFEEFIGPADFNQALAPYHSVHLTATARDVMMNHLEQGHRPESIVELLEDYGGPGESYWHKLKDDWTATIAGHLHSIESEEV